MAKNQHYVSAYRSVRKQVAKELAGLRKKKARAKPGATDHAELSDAISALKVVHEKVGDCCEVMPRARR